MFNYTRKHAGLWLQSVAYTQKCFDNWIKFTSVINTFTALKYSLSCRVRLGVLQTSLFGYSCNLQSLIVYYIGPLRGHCGIVLVQFCDQYYKTF
jgi:hypothetical protein